MENHPPDFDPHLPPDPSERDGQLDDQTADQVAHGGLGVITRMRLRHAEAVVDNMDHKDRLYEEVGQIAASGRREAPQNERPHTVPERFIDWRLQRKSDKKVRHDVYAHRAMKIHGEDTTPHTPSVRHGATESLLGVAIGRDHSHTFGEVIWGNIKRLFDGPALRGFTGLKRKIEKAKIIGRVVSNGATAAEARQQWQDVNAEKMKLGNKMHKRTRRQARKHNERVELVAEGPIRQVWRDGRRAMAQATIERIENGDTVLQRGAERTERAAHASARAGRLALDETVATTRTARKGGRVAASFSADVGRGVADIYRKAAKGAARQTTKGIRSIISKTRNKS